MIITELCILWVISVQVAPISEKKNHCCKLWHLKQAPAPPLRVPRGAGCPVSSGGAGGRGVFRCREWKCILACKHDTRPLLNHTSWLKSIWMVKGWCGWDTPEEMRAHSSDWVTVTFPCSVCDARSVNQYFAFPRSSDISAGQTCLLTRLCWNGWSGNRLPYVGCVTSSATDMQKWCPVSEVNISTSHSCSSVLFPACRKSL